MLFLDARGVTFARALPPWLVDTFNEITDYGKSGWFLVPLAGLIVAAAIFAPVAGRIANLVLASLVVRLTYLFLAIAVPGLVVTVVKRLIGRVRPVGRPDLSPISRGPGSTSTRACRPGTRPRRSRPRCAIAALWPRTRIPMLIFAVVIATSRVVITAHFVSDVVAAAFVGAFGAILVRNWYAARGLAFVPGPDGAVHVRPGPSWRRVKAVARRLIGQ